MNGEDQQEAIHKAQRDLLEAASSLKVAANGLAALAKTLPEAYAALTAPAPVTPVAPPRPGPAFQAPMPPGPQAQPRPSAAPPQYNGPAGPGWYAPQSQWATPAPAAPPVGPPPPPGPQNPASAGPNLPPMPVRAPVAPRKPRRKVSVAEVFSLVGSAITLIGVVLMLVLPQDGVVGPVARTIIAATLAVAAIATAWWQHSKDAHNVGAHALMATGVASAFLCIIADTVLFVDADGHGMLPQLAGLALAGLVSIGGVWVAKIWKSQWLAVLAILGSLLLAPFLSVTPFTWCLAFMVTMTVLTAVLQHGLGWTWLTAARVIPTCTVFLWSAFWSAPGTPGLAVITLALAVVLAMTGLVEAVLNQRLTRSEQVAAVAAMVPLSGPLMLVCWQGDQVTAAIATGIVGLVLTACGFIPSRFTNLVRSAAIPLGAMFVGFAILRATNGAHGGYIFFGLAAVYLAVSATTKFRPVLVVGAVFAFLGLAHWKDLLFTPLSAYTASGHSFAHVIESILGLAVTLFAARAIRAFRTRPRPGLTYLTWGASLMFGTVAVVLAGTVIGDHNGNTVGWFQGAHAAATISWLLLCVVLLRRALHGKDSVTSVRLAVVLAALAVIKLIMFDLGTQAGLVRVIAFLGVGVLLLIIGTWYARQLERVRRAEAAAAAAPAPAPVTEAAPPASTPGAETTP